MRFATLGFLLVVSGVALPLWAVDPVPPTVTQLQVQKKTADDLTVNLFSSEGVRFVVVLAQPEQFILGVDEEGSKLISATDDKGTDLAESNGEKWVGAFFSHVSKNRHKIAIPVTLNTLPAAGATTMAVKGEIVLQCGSEEKTEEIKPFELAKGSNTKYGVHTMKIEINKNRFFGGNDEKTQNLSVTLNGKGYWLKTLEFVDEKGAVIKSESAGSTISSDIVTRFVTVSSDVKMAGARVTYYQKSEVVRRAIDMKIGVGLP